MRNETQNQHNYRQTIVFLLSLYRGIVAIVLGVVLIFYPDKTPVLLANLMGFFWLSTGFALIHHNPYPALGKRTSWVLGLAATLAGLVVISRRILRHWLDEGTAISLLGMVVFLTGVLHIMGDIRFGRVTKHKRGRTTVHFLLGVFEVFLGALLLLSPLEYGPFIYWSATIWALLFGTLVIGGALYERVWRHQEQEG